MDVYHGFTLPLNPFRVHNGIGIGGSLSGLGRIRLGLARTIHLQHSRFGFGQFLLCRPISICRGRLDLLVVAVLIRRRGRTGGGGRGRQRDGDGHAPIFREHGHELLVVQAVEPIAVVADRIPVLPRLEEGDRVARRPPVGPTPRGRELEELIDPRRLAAATAGVRGRRPVWGDEVGYMGWWLRHAICKSGT